MDLSAVSMVVSVAALSVAVVAMVKKNEKKESAGAGFDSMPLRLQAYERLVLLTERIALPNLIARLSQPGIAAAEMKLILVEHIKQEFEYNSTQQLYVSQIAWDALRNLKEQNIMIIHQVAATLPPTASGADLNKKILELLMSQPNASPHEMVAQALNFEAKKMML